MAKAIEIELDEGAKEVSEYGINTNVDDNAFRLRMYDDEGNVLSNFETDAAGAYELAQRILRGYDILEGL